MQKRTHKPSRVKPPEDARVTPASDEAATADGDGGRVLGELEPTVGVDLAPLERFFRGLPALQRLSESLRRDGQDWPAGHFGAQRHAEPEPLAVAALSGASERRLRAPTQQGGGGAESTQGGPGRAAAWVRWGKLRRRFGTVAAALAFARELESLPSLRGHVEVLIVVRLRVVRRHP